MKQKPGGEPPNSTDLEGWRSAIAADRLDDFRPEAIVAAFQDLGPNAPDVVRNGLTKHLSRIIMGMLRKRVGVNRPNKGRDIIDDAHDRIFMAMLQPQSADGKGLREAFGSRVCFRLKDTLAKELKALTIPAPKTKIQRDEEKKKKGVPGVDEIEIVGLEYDPSRAPELDDANEEQGPGENNFDHEAFAEAQAYEDKMDSDRLVNRVLEAIPSYKKRFAYRLHLHDVRRKSKKESSIAQALGVNERTVRLWIEEIENNLKQNEEVQKLLKARTGAKS